MKRNGLARMFCYYSQLVSNQAIKNKFYLAWLAQDRFQPQMIPPIVILEEDTHLVSVVQSKRQKTH